MGRASKDKRDMYYRKAKEEGYRARSAYKLLQLDEEFHLLSRDRIRTGVVDLCAAPGSWSQVLAHHLRPAPADSRDCPRIVAVDLQEIMPIEGVCLLQGDITSEATAREIIRLLNARDGDSAAAGEDAEGESKFQRKADLVVCDGAPDVTGMHELDEYLQHHLLLAALNITTVVIRPGGTFVTKMFRGPNTAFLVAKSELFFRHVTIAKPKSSRNASMEAFLVCQDFRPPEGFAPSLRHPLTATSAEEKIAAEREKEEKGKREEIEMEMEKERERDRSFLYSSMSRAERIMVPFLACGDLTGYDADMCYDRDETRDVLPPVQPPTQAPYISVASPQTVIKATTTTTAECTAVRDEVPEEVKRRRVEEQ